MTIIMKIMVLQDMTPYLVTDKSAAFIFGFYCILNTWCQVTSKRCYSFATLHGFSFQKFVNLVLTAVITSNITWLI